MVSFLPPLPPAHRSIRPQEYQRRFSEWENRLTVARDRGRGWSTTIKEGLPGALCTTRQTGRLQRMDLDQANLQGHMSGTPTESLGQFGNCFNSMVCQMLRQRPRELHLAKWTVRMMMIMFGQRLTCKESTSAHKSILDSPFHIHPLPRLHVHLKCPLQANSRLARARPRFTKVAKRRRNCEWSSCVQFGARVHFGAHHNE